MYIRLDNYGGLFMQEVAIKTWGNSFGIRIPINILQKLNLKANDKLQLSIVDDSIVLKKQFSHKTFEERMAEYNNQISVCDFEWGEPVGKELI